jgi:hypothetical protein
MNVLMPHLKTAEPLGNDEPDVDEEPATANPLGAWVFMFEFYLILIHITLKMNITA